MKKRYKIKSKLDKNIGQKIYWVVDTLNNVDMSNPTTDKASVRETANYFNK